MSSYSDTLFILPSVVCEFNSDIKGEYISKREREKKNEKGVQVLYARCARSKKIFEQETK